MKHGVFCLSFDVEGRWGRQQLLDYERFIPLIRQETSVVQTLLAILAHYTMQATWAVVGKLFEEDRKLIRMLGASNHEIASHSYTHPDFAHITKHEAHEELTHCTAVARKYGVRLRSFVFPYNHIHHLDVLATHGFLSYRKGGMYFPSTRKWGKLLPGGVRLFQAKRGLDRVARTGQVFHLWSHPIDLIDGSGQLLMEFEAILRYADTVKKQGKIEIKTMNQL